MVDILHRIGAKAPVFTVYNALTTIDGLAGWWTRDTKGDPTVGGTIAFRFLQGGFDMEVVELKPDELVTWKVVDGPEEWIGTDVHFRLSRAADYTIVLFSHEGWGEPVEFMYHCSTKWGSYLQSLKALAETGTGAPAPDDVQISDWH